MNKSNVMVAQSGGPTAAINSSLSGVISSAIQSSEIQHVYGAINGIQGLLKENIIQLNTLFEKEDYDLNILKTTPAMFLGSCRYKLPKDCEDTFEKVFSIFASYNIGYFFYIGGNDSMDTVLKLSAYAKKNNHDVKIIGIPKTIDNDLFGTDHSPGFGSAAKFVSTSLLDIAHDSYIYDTESITIVEIMGRNAGWLTAASALARNTYNASPDLIYLPEVPFSKLNFLNDIKECFKKKKNIIIAVSEGLKNDEGEYISTSTGTSHDAFGHATLSGTGKSLERLVKTAFNCKVRSIELNVLQRSAMHSASGQDIEEAFLLGSKAVEIALKGSTGKMMILQRDSNKPYTVRIDSIDIENVANKERKVPLTMINKEGNDVTEEMIAYLKPLVQGNTPVVYENGMPKYMSIQHLISM